MTTKHGRDNDLSDLVFYDFGFVTSAQRHEWTKSNLCSIPSYTNQMNSM